MPVEDLWEGYEFDEERFELWAEHLYDAAMSLAPDERAGFLAIACQGSAELLSKTRSLLHNAMDSGPWQQPPEPRLCRSGDVVCDCLILAYIGKGSTAEVYTAIQRPLRRLVAVKVIREVEQGAFTREAINTSLLNHENVIQVYAADLHGERPCVVMEYVEGTTLREWLHRQQERGSLPSQVLVRSMAQQILTAMDAAHARKLIHRDLKPENILLASANEPPVVKIADFGLARHPAGGPCKVAGTPGYISPEVLSGAPPNERADIFSVGVILYEMLTGQHPFLEEDELQTLHNTLSVDPAKLGHALPAEFASVVFRALHKDPAQRFQTMHDLLEALREGGATEGNPFFSEFPAAIRRWLNRSGSGFEIAGISFVWGWLSFVLSVLCGAACLKVVWKPQSGDASWTMTYGYGVELNAALFYIFCAPLCFIGGFLLFQAAHKGLEKTAALTGLAGVHPLERIAEWNQRVFRVMLPFSILLATCVVGIPEVALRQSGSFGWVQADLAPRYLNASYDELRQANEIGELPAVEKLRSNCSAADCIIRMDSVQNRRDGYDPPNKLLFAAFLFSALTHQILLSALFAYISFKVLFLFGMLSAAVLGLEKAGIRLTPDVEDRSDFRFGLGRMDNVYHGVLILLLFASSAVLLQVVTNLNKGTYFVGRIAVVLLIGQAVTLVSASMLLAVLVVTPVVLFLFLTVHTVNHELEHLAHATKELHERRRRTARAEERAKIEEDLAELDQRRSIIHRQSLLPTKSPLFRGLLIANVLMLALAPFVLVGTELGAGAARRLSDLLCALCGG